MSNTNAVSKILAVAAACGLLACASDGEDPTTDQSGTEPTLFGGQRREDERQSAENRADMARATGAVARAISYNHPEPHTLVIPVTDLIKGRAGWYTLTEGGGALGELHTHDVLLTERDMSQIADGAEVTLETTPAGERGMHTHFVTIARR